MFKRPHHQRIAHVLAALNSDVLAQHQCWFGGGTCIALRYGKSHRQGRAKGRLARPVHASHGHGNT